MLCMQIILQTFDTYDIFSLNKTERITKLGMFFQKKTYNTMKKMYIFEVVKERMEVSQKLLVR